jgi:hypothetical protein
MSSTLDQQPLTVINKGKKLDAVKLLKFLSDHRFTILDDHKDIIHHHRRFTNPNPDKDEYNGRSSPSISEADHKIICDVMSIAAAYANQVDKYNLS